MCRSLLAPRLLSERSETKRVQCGAIRVQLAPPVIRSPYAPGLVNERVDALNSVDRDGCDLA
jgi:hypothetical protein